ncbi:MAG TPA: DUF2723 domain-containing protein [Polyangia bacterium]|jgi:hypothetical protein|nr:DUF2723 domain-containing protein [Polyangia bacterium]
MVESARRDPSRTAAWLVFLACLCAYVFGLAPGPYWLDSSEFAGAAATLGIAHPPGHPLALLLGKALALVPLGPVAMRVALASALAGAAAASLVALIGAGLARRVLRALKTSEARDEKASLTAALLGIAAGLGFGLSYAAAFQAVRAEVYALHVCLQLGSIHVLLGSDEHPERTPRALPLGAFAASLALANHTLLAGLHAICAALFVLTGLGRLPWRRQLRTLAWAAGAVLLGLAVYAYLPLRAGRHPLIDWGAPLTFDRFAWTVSASAFQKSLAHATSGDAPAIVFVLGRELALLAPLALLGLYALARLHDTRRAALLLTTAALASAAAPALVGFDAENPDAYGYLAPAVGLLASVAAAGGAALCGLVPVAPATSPPKPWRPALRLGLPGALALAVLLLGLQAAPRWSRTRCADTERHTHELLAEAPPRALLVSSYFQTVFALWYAQAVEGQRPDVDLVHRHFLAYPGYSDELLRRAPELAPLLGPRDVLAGPLAAAAQDRPVVLEYDLDLAAALVRRLLPGGLVDRLLPAEPELGQRAEGAAHAVQRRDRLHRLLDVREPQTRRVLLWGDFLAAARDCHLGLHATSAQTLARARGLLAAPDPDLEALAQRCRPAP